MPEPRPARRRPFQRRLTLTLGAALAVVLALLGAAVLAGAYVGMTRQAHAALDAEIRNIEAHIVRPDGTLDLEAKPWDEPHHRYLDAHIDPYFVQVFDPQGRLLRTSANAARLAATYPRRVLPSADRGAWFTPLRLFEIEDAHFGAEAQRRSFYYLTAPMRQDGQVLGTLQVARYEPGIGPVVARLALGVGVGYAAVLGALLALVWAIGGRVVRPLQAITAHARSLAPTRLGARVPIPEDADCETDELARALNAALDRLEAAFEEMRRFTSDAAHELQTPLTVLLGHLEVALRRERSPEAYRATLEVLRVETEGLAGTVRGLLALARLEQSQQVLPVTPVALDQVVAAEAEHACATAETKGLDFRLDLVPVTVEGHTELLREVARNLLDNAVKYTDEGTIRVSLARADGNARLVVEDTGNGIAPAHLDDATRRFWRADAVQHLPGSGLGLALVERIVTHHGGTLRLTSEPGAGTQVEVQLPASEPDAPEA